MASKRAKVKKNQMHRRASPTKAKYSGLKELFRINGLLDKDGNTTMRGMEALSLRAFQ